VKALDIEVDTSTPAGALIAYVLMATALWERPIIGQLTKEVLAEARASGTPLGNPVVLPSEVRARILADRKRGHSYGKIADRLDDRRLAPAGRPGSARTALLSAPSVTGPDDRCRPHD